MIRQTENKAGRYVNAILRQYSRIIPILLLLSGLYLVPVRIMHTDLSQIPGDLGDARFIVYILEHGYQYITGQINVYWDAPFLYPVKDVISLSDNLLGSLPFYAVFRIAGVNMETSLQLWFISICALNFIFCYLALKSWLGDTILASAGSYIYAFSIFTLSQMSHLQVFPRFMIPLIFLWSFNFFKTGKIKYAYYTALGFIIQLYCGMYLGVFAAIAIIIFNLSYLITYHEWKKIPIKKFIISKLSLIPVLAISIILVYPLLDHYLNTSIKLGYGDFSETYNFLPTLRSYFFAHNGSKTWSVLVDHGINSFEFYWNHQLFSGILPWLGITAAPFLLLSKKVNSADKKFIIFLLASTLLLFLAFLRFGQFSFYKYLFNVPGIGSIRELTRIINVQIFLLILIFVTVFNILNKKYYLIKVFILALPALVLYDNSFDPAWIKTFSKNEAIARTTTIEKTLMNAPVQNYDAVAYVPLAIESNLHYAYHIDAMIACQKLHLNCINGYTGNFPSKYLDFFRNMDYGSMVSWITLNGIPENKILVVNELGLVTTEIKNVYLFCSNNKYLSTEGPDRLIADKSHSQQWEEFTLYHLQNGNWMIKTYNHYFLSTDTLQNERVYGTKNMNLSQNEFAISTLPDGFTRIKGINNRYLEISKPDSLLHSTTDSLSASARFKFIPVIR